MRGYEVWGFALRPYRQCSGFRLKMVSGVGCQVLVSKFALTPETRHLKPINPDSSKIKI
jgi:hypothetical protein